MNSTIKLNILALSLLVLAASANAQSPPEDLLKQMVGQLQQTPNDNALREKIIKLGAEIKPAPVVPPEAKRPFVMAGTYQKEAKKPSDFALAIDAYKDALKVAPWWGDAYYNLSVSLESASRLDEARDALQLYLLTKPNDVEEAQNRLYALEAKKNIVAKQAAEAVAKKTEEDKQAAIRAQGKQYEGNWYRVVQFVGGESVRQSFTIDRDPNGNRRMSGRFTSRSHDIRLEGAEFKFKDQAEYPSPDEGPIEYTGSLSADGSRLKFVFKDLPPTPAQQQVRLRMRRGGGPPYDRYGHGEWLKE